MRGYRIHAATNYVDALLPMALACGVALGLVFAATRTSSVRPSSIQPLTSNGTVMCTAFSVNDQKRLFVSAAHCLDDEEGNTLTLGGGAFVVLRTDAVNDLSLLLSVYSAPAYVLGPQPGVGDEVTIRGFAFHNPNALNMYGRVASPDYTLPGVTPRLVLNLELIRGFSGSPVLVDGQVVSVSQGVAAPFPVGRFSWGARWEALRDFVGQDWR